MAIMPSRIGIVLAALAVPLCATATPDRVVLQGNIPAATALAEPLGRPDPAMPMARMLLSLAIPPAAQAQLTSLLSQQQDPKSPLFHQWLSPEAFGAQFGPGQQDLDSVLLWLQENGFTVEQVSAGRTAIVFSGSVQQVEQAFQTLILDYQLNGQAFHANAIDPSIPGALAGVIQGVVSLHNLPRKALNRVLPLETASNGSHYLAPGDFATIYDVKPLYNSSINGTGVTIAIVGRTHPALSDITTFRSNFGLPANNPSFIVNGADPGDLGSDEDVEADLDMEWSGAVAPNAAVKFVISASTASTDGVDLSAQYIVDNNLAAVMSTSFGQCEGLMGSAEDAFYNNLWSQAAAEGITAMVSSGDNGAAGCEGNSGLSLGVNGLGSSPYNVCVGGTEFNDAAGSYWAASNGAGQSSALGYIPETAWNESGLVPGGSGDWATGGGASTIYAKPAWQVAPGVPADGHRDVPDVSLSAAGHDGYLIESGGIQGAVGGTSCSSPAFTGLMALVVQKTGQRQGNANPILYQMGNAQYKGTGPAVFHDILTGNNSVPGVTGFSCGTGYSQATGLGSVDASALVTGWNGAAANKVTAAIAAPSANETVASGATVNFSGTATDSSASASLSYAWSFGDGSSTTGASPSHTFSNTGTASAADTVTLTVTDSTGVSATATRTITVTPAPRNTLTATITSPAANETVASGATVAFAASVKDSSAAATLSYAWNFGDGTSATGAAQSHKFTNTGTANAVNTVTLTVTDNTLASATATRTITVTPAPRNTLTATIASPAANETVASGATVAFAASVKDSSATATLTYAWNFGDGTSATSAAPSHTFTNTGSTSAVNTVTLTVTDNTLASATATRTITVAPVPRNTLTAAITSPAASETVASGATVAFAGSGKDSSATATLSYAWNFGDGTSAAGTAPSHTFSNTGGANATYAVILTVTDNTGVSATATRSITVSPAPAGTLTAVISSPAGNVTVSSGTTLQLVATITDTNASPVLDYGWSASSPVAATVGPRTLVSPTTLNSVVTATFTNTTRTAYSVTFTLTVTDNHGAKASASRTVTVNPI